MSNLRTKIDPGTLRDSPVDKKAFEKNIAALQLAVKSEKLTPTEKVVLLSNLGEYLRILGDLSQAEKNLRLALSLNTDHNLGLAREVQIQLRLAIVMQHLGQYKECDINYDILIELCRRFPEANPYLDFALQHSGKSLFEQKKYKSALKRFQEALTLRESQKAPQDLVDSTRLAIKATLARI